METDEGLGQRVQTGPMGVGARPAEGGHVGLDNGGVQRGQCIAADAYAVSRPGTHICNQDVHLSGNSRDDFLALFGARIDRNRPLVGVEKREVYGVRRTGDVPLRWLQLYDLGAQHRQQLAGTGSRYHVGCLHHFYAVERLRQSFRLVPIPRAGLRFAG